MQDIFAGPVQIYPGYIRVRNPDRHIFPARLFLRPYTVSARSKLSPNADMGADNIFIFVCFTANGGFTRIYLILFQ